ncbi:MAG: hypothetical protein CMJ19_19675 [Phycisphaeraceae bacterium]|nr:hypothetical protein [Phycisphaeraceae bacterium]
MLNLTPTAEGRAICPRHGDHFQLLFVRDPALLPPDPTQAPPLAPDTPGNEPVQVTEAAPAEKLKYCCDGCQRTYELLPEMVGKDVKCQCGHVGTVTLPSDALAQDDGTYELAESAPPTTPQTTRVNSTACKRHPDMPVIANCGRCRAAVCATCDFAYPDGSHLCPDCASGVTSRIAANIPAINAQCIHHPDVQAVAVCMECHTPVCNTCVFTYPGNVHLCPACATNPVKKLTSGRKSLAIWSIVLAVWSFLALGALVLGVFEEIAQESEDALGVILMYVGILPSLVGTAIGVASRDKNRGNPPITWIGMIANGIILGMWFLLMIVGMLAG